MTKTKIGLIALSALLITLFMFRQPIFIAALDWYVHRYCRECFEAEMNTGEITFENQSWIIKTPILKTKKSLSEGGWTLEAEHLILAPHWQFWKRSIDLEITLVKPKLNLIEIAPPSSPFEKSSLTPFAAILFFKSQGLFLLQEGEIILNNLENTSLKPFKTIGVEFNAQWGTHLKTTLVADFDKGADSKKNQLRASFEQNSEESLGRLFLNEVDCKALSELIERLPLSKKDWKVLEGTISGDLTLTRLQEEAIAIDGEALLKNFAFENSTLYLQGKIPQGRLTFKPYPQFEFLSDASFSLHRRKDHSVFWKMDQIEGSLHLFSNSLAISLKTDLAMLANSIPFLVNKGIAKLLPNDPIVIKADVTQKLGNTAVEGVLNSGKQVIPFSFDFEKTERTSGIKNGQFQISNLSLENYTTPLLFKNAHLQGNVDIVGVFDHQKLDLQYALQDLIFDHPLFTLKSPRMGDLQQASGTSPVISSKASHHLDLITGHHQGSIPLKNASFMEKKSGLVVSEISSHLLIKDDFWHCQAIEAFCQGIYFAGDIDINPVKKTFKNALEGYQVNIHAHTASGKVSQFQELLEGFHQAQFLVDLPLAGDLALGSKGGDIHLFINSETPEISLLNTSLEGSLSEGSMSCANAHIALQDLSLDFDYNESAKMLAFSNIQGALLLGKADHVEEYSFSGDRVHFDDYSQGLAEFDIWVSDKKRDLIRLAGKTTLWENRANVIAFTLDHKLSHFVDTHPSAFQLVLKDWSQIESLHLQLDFQLSTLLSDLQRFSKTGLLFLSRHALKGLNELKAVEGQVNVDLEYDNRTSFLNYKATATNFALGEKRFNKCLLNGKKKDHAWEISQLQLDELTLSANLTQLKESWKVDFLGIRYGKSLLIGMDGEYIPSQLTFNGKINLLEINLAELEELKFSKNVIQECCPKGQLRGTGEMRLAISDKLPKWHLETNLKAHVHAFELKGIHFQDIENMDLHYSSNEGLRIKNVKSAVKNSLDTPLKTGIQLDHFYYDFIDHEIRLNQFQFSVAAQNLSSMADLIHKNFPQIVGPSLCDLIKEIEPVGIYPTSIRSQDKNKNALSGILNMEISPSSYTLSLSLSDLLYKAFNQKFTIKNFSLKNNPLEFKIHADCVLDQHLFSTTLRSKSWNLESGELVIGENQPPLILTWKKTPHQNMFIEKIQGTLLGLSANLEHSPLINFPANPKIENADPLSFQGHLTLDTETADGLPLPVEILDMIAKWKIKGEYALLGQWQFKTKGDIETAFSGTLNAENCSFEIALKPFHLQSFSTQVAYSQGDLKLQNLEISGPLGFAKASLIALQKNGYDQWTLEIPAIKIAQFNPSVVWPDLFSPTAAVRDFELNKLNGNLSNLHSFKGEGRLSFVNPSAKSSPLNLLALPSRALPSLTLPAQLVSAAAISEVTDTSSSMAALGPSSGKIFYHLDEGKIYFDRFKDFYSQDRLSKFYIAHSKESSTLGFDGTLNLHVKMKQYNVVFKLAELFTLSIGGHLNSPTYTLYKRGHKK